MPAVTIKFAPFTVMRDMYGQPCRKSFVKDNLSHYTSISVDIGLDTAPGEEVAEEVFDLSNNPSRENERATVYGNHRSVSVGDVVGVDGVDYLCDSFGWVVL